FTNTPPLPLVFSFRKVGSTDPQIQITPSKLADVPLSDKAIPYYYQQSGEPPLFELWNAEKTQHNRANQNLSYRSYQYQPVAPVFITDPLRYDLEPYNFLRIEGHLGKNYQSVMNTLLTLKARYRLPIEVIALRTGAFDNTITVDLTKESSRFQDLEALYDVLREELLSNLCEGMMYLYDVVIDGAKLSGGTPKMPLLKNYAPNYRYKANTVGAWYEKYLTRIQAIPYIDVDQNAIDANTLFLVYCQLFSGTVAPDPKYYAHIVSIYYFSKLAEILPLSLNQLGYANFENKYQDLLELTRYFRGTVQVSTDLQQFIPQEELIDHFDQVLFSCKLQAVKATHDEYLRRLRELKQKQFLSDFLQKNPAIQHKAGVPLGGTFIIVYHDNPPLAAPPINFTFNPAILRTTSEQAMSAAFTRLQSKQNFVLDADFQLIFSELTGHLPLLNPSVLDAIQNTAFDEIMDDTISEFTDGTVIADFYLPYRFNADGQAIQFVLPKIPPTFTVNIGCANADGALVTVTPKGGLSPYSIKIDTGEYQSLGETFTLASGEHTLRIRDAEDSESTPQTIKVALPLHIALSKEPQCSADSQTYTATFTISDGTPPYSVNGVAINGNSYTTDSIASGSTAKITVMDKLNCSAETTISHTCPPPCDLPNKGLSRRCAYRLWLQPKPWISYRNYKVTSGIKFRFNGKDFDIGDLLQISVDELNKDFPVALAAPIEILNKVVNETINSAFGVLSKNRLTISYTPTKTDPFEVLWIEHFIEDTFAIEFNFTYSTESIAFALNVRYSNEQVVGASAFNGMILTNVRSGEQRRVPAFDCSERNQCEDSAFVKLCEGFEVKPAFVSTQTGEQNLFRFTLAEGMPKTGIAAWVWDFSTSSSEPFYVGDAIEFNWQPGGFIKLTAITDKGCFSSTLENRT
ncbi:MAG: hypothetical protein LUQ28_12025, partial [Methylococcaceae bacterium]|nr:hypothetical protein [Methylococcaceae bacterium]